MLYFIPHAFLIFTALILEPKKLYAQNVKHPFHISMASLDTVDAGIQVVYFKIFEKILITLETCFFFFFF